MNLRNKRLLVTRTLGIGKARIQFAEKRFADIKEAITKQDIKDLIADGAIMIKDVRGRKKIEKHRNRSVGNVRKKVNVRKKRYVVMTRKLRRYIAEMKKQDKVSREDFKDIRKKIKNKKFPSLASLKTYLGELKK